MGNRHNQFPPALKHAGYSAMNVLPGESAAEFDKLHKGLIAEYSSNGVHEDEIIETMARLIWRKKNLATVRIAKLAQAHWSRIKWEMVPEDKMDSAYELPMLGRVIEKVDPAVREAAMRAAINRARKELGETYGLVEMGEAVELDQLMKDLDVEDRLDRQIDRCLKRLLFVRGLKSISSSPAATSSTPHKQLSAA